MNNLIPPADLLTNSKIGGFGVAKGVAISTADFEKFGEGVIANMVKQGFIEPDYRILDMRCGPGRMARPLTKILSKTGEYHGVDIVKPFINWCGKNYNKFNDFHFDHADIFSTHYNREGKLSAATYQFFFKDNYFDFIFSTSLFTHMLLNEIDHYLGEMRRVLKPGARCWNTILVMDNVAAERAAKLDPSDPHYMPHVIEHGRVKFADNPTGQIAFYEEPIRALHDRNGLEILEIRYGPLSGRKDNVRAGGQDIVIARKP